MFAVSIDWIFEHLQILVIVGAVIASMVTKVLKNRRESDAADHLPPKVPVKGMDEGDAARVREEIARKRAERMRQMQEPSPLEAPRPIATEHIPEIFQRRVESPPPLPPEPVRAAHVEESRLDAERTLARQLALAEKLKELQSRRDAHAQQASFIKHGEPVDARGSVKHVQSEALLAMARNPAELRKAVVMIEVLGKPLALR